MRIVAAASAAALLMAGMASGPLAQEGSDAAVARIQPLAEVHEHVDGTAFNVPRGLHYDALHDEIFVADSGNAIIGIFDGRGVPKFMFAPGGERSYPVSIETDPEGNIYVLSPGARQILVFDYRGEPAGEIPLGEVENVVVVPSGMGRGPDGKLYVLDAGAGRILVYRLDGNLERVIRGPGRGGSRLQTPYDIAFDTSGNLYVSDSYGTAVQVYDSEGNYLRGWGQHDVGVSNFSFPAGISVDLDGRVFVADTLRQDIKIFDNKGKYLGNFGGYGRRPGDVTYPIDVVAGPNGRIYVLERVGQRLQVFSGLSRGISRSGAPGDATPRLENQQSGGTEETESARQQK